MIQRIPSPQAPALPWAKRLNAPLILCEDDELIHAWRDSASDASIRALLGVQKRFQQFAHNLFMVLESVGHPDSIKDREDSVYPIKKALIQGAVFEMLKQAEPLFTLNEIDLLLHRLDFEDRLIIIDHCLASGLWQAPAGEVGAA